MKTYNIFTNEIDSLPHGKADFLLATKTPNHKTLLNDDTPEGIYSFALITRAIENLNPFSFIETFDITNQSKTSTNAKDIFADGMALGRSYELKGSYLILAQNSFGVAQNALATLKSLSDNTQTSNFEKLSLVCDETLIFCAGFLLEASRRFHVVVGGGIEMAVCLLIADKVREDVLMRLKSDNISFATTSWAAKGTNIKEVLEQLSYKPHAIYTTLDLENVEIQRLKKYEEQEEKDGMGAGASLAYATTNGLTNKAVLNEMELILYMA